MANSEDVNNAVNQHLSEEVERLEREVADLRQLLARPITVNTPTPPINYTQTPYQSSVISTLNMMSSSLMSIQQSLTSLTAAANRAHPPQP